MACGVPVVGTAVGGLPDTIVPRATGLLVPPRDPGAVARAIGCLLDDPPRRLRMGDAASARVRRQFTWDLVARSTLEVYERVRARGLHAPGGKWAEIA